MKTNSWIGIAFLALALLSPAWADTDIDSTPADSKADAGRIVKWAWEIAEESAEHPHTNYSYWTPVTSPLGGGLRFLHFRDREEHDDFVFSGYFFFRPVVFDFTDFHIAVGAYTVVESSWGEFRDVYDSLNPDSTYTTYGSGLVGGASALFSYPELGIQMTFELGHYWTRGKLRASDLQMTIPYPAADGRFHYLQEETGLDIFYNFTWMTERNYLSAISLNLMSTYRTGSAEITARVEHPAGRFDVEIDDFPSDFVLGLCYVKALSIPLKEKFSKLPISQHDFVTLEPLAGIGYFAEGHGHVITAGVRVSVFDSIAFSYFHNWEEQNDAADSDIFLLELGIQLGRRLGPGR